MQAMHPLRAIPFTLKGTLAMSLTAVTITAMSPLHAEPQRLFVSGHSLTDPPLPAFLTLVATSKGTPLQWNMQSLPGSPIRVRAQGEDPAHAFRHGSNRDGRNLDVLAEWQAPRTVSGGLYDTLLVAEQHGVLGAIAWQGSVAALRDIDQRFKAANPRATTWFYESWLGVLNLDDPSRWMAYERAASPVWACVAAKASAPAGTAQTAIRSIPTGVALVWLVEKALAGQVADLSPAGAADHHPGAVMRALFSDDVHLKPVAQYYMASVLYGWMWLQSPEGAAHPPDVSAPLARALQKHAWAFVQQARQANGQAGLPCAAQPSAAFVQQHWGYVRDQAIAQGTPAWRAWFEWAKRCAQWHAQRLGFGAPRPFGP